MQFTDAHSSSGVCSPSRYTLLTGRYHWRSRLQAGIVGYLERPLIAPDRLNVAGLVEPQGYHTACFGKWHLGWDWNVPAEQRALFAPGRGQFPEVTERHRHAWRDYYSRPIGGGPTARGFNEYFGTDVPNWPPYCFIEDDRTVGIPSEFLAEALFRDHLASLPGPALDDWALNEVLPTIVERACESIEQQARTGRPFFLYLPLTSPHTPLAVNAPWRGKSGLDSAVADLVMETDAEVGRVLAAIDASGMADNTLVVFTSDNGFAPYVGAEHLEAQGHFPSGPLRGYKGDAWEGGHRVPFLVRWPGVVEPGTVCAARASGGHHGDRGRHPRRGVARQRRGRQRQPLAAVERGSRSGPRPCDQPGGEGPVRPASRPLEDALRARWRRPWSRLSTNEPDGHPAQLYNLDDDIGETRNLYAEHPEIVQEMTELLERLITSGRSTPGPAQKNDVPVNW